MREQQTQGERERVVLFSPREPPIPRCRKHWRTCGRTADGRTDVRMWLYDTLDRSRRTRVHGRAEKKMEWKKKCCFARPLGETVETRGDRAMIEEERREVGLSASEERLPMSTFLPSFTHIPTPINLPTLCPTNPTSRTQTRLRVCTLTNEKPRGVLRKPLLPKYITLSMQSVERATGVAASRWRAS